MRDFDLMLALELSGRAGEAALAGPAGEPVFLRIARAVIAAITDGRLGAGAALPGSRALAAVLGVHRNTVLAALRELESEGWVESQPARGTFVRAELPERSPRALPGVPRATRDPSRLGFTLRGEAPSTEALMRMVPSARSARSARGVPSVIELYGGTPDLRLLPPNMLAGAWRRVLAGGARSGLGAEGRRLMSYGGPAGDERLVRALGAMLARTRGIAQAERGLLVTRGSQMAMHLAARALLAPGDVVAVEAVGYRPAWEALRLAGARVVPVRVDGDGLCTEALEALCRRRRVRAVYVTPHHQYPTTVLMAPGRRAELLALARRHHLAILEDDYDNEFHYDGRPSLPLCSADEAGHVIYLGTLSKNVAPGLRLGYLLAPEPVARRASELRLFLDRQGDHAMERAIAGLLEEGELQRHARKMRRVYQARRDAMAGALARHLGGALEFQVPGGGMAIWARAARGIDVEAWAVRAAAAGVMVHTGRRFTFDARPLGALRLGFAGTNEREIELGVRRLAATVEQRSSVTRAV